MSVLGILLLFLGVGLTLTVFGMVLAGRLSDRWGAHALSLATGLMLAASLGTFAVVPTYAWFVVAVTALLVSSGSFDVAINAVAIGVEQRTGRQLLPLLHAAFSAGGAVGAASGGLIVASGTDFRLGYPAVANLVAGIMLAWRATSGPATASVHEGVAPLGASVYRSPMLLVLAVLVALGFLGEGAMETWSAIYLRGSLGGTPLVGATGVAVFHIAMLVGRLLTAAASRRVGRVATVRGPGGLVALAMVL